MLNYTPLKISSNQKVSRQMVVAGGVATVFAFGILSFLAWTLNSIQSQNIYLADRLDTYTSGVTKVSAQDGGQVAGAETSSAVLPPEAETTRNKVESMIFIPVVGDIPTFALIDNLAKVQNEAFFTKAQVGDHLFVYPKSKVAVLYRPSALKVINMADINSGQQTQETSSTQTQDQSQAQETTRGMKPSKKTESTFTLLVAYSQGVESDRVNSAKESASKVQNIVISDEEAVSTIDPIPKNRIVNISGNQKAVDDLLEMFEAEEGPLPDGVSASDADIVLILAKD